MTAFVADLVSPIIGFIWQSAIAYGRVREAAKAGGERLGIHYPVVKNRRSHELAAALLQMLVSIRKKEPRASHGARSGSSLSRSSGLAFRTRRRCGQFRQLDIVRKIDP